MKRTLCWISLVAFWAFSTPAAVHVASDQVNTGSGFNFKDIAGPAANDAGTEASWKLIEGRKDRNSATLSALFDGRLPGKDDDPGNNFFFDAGSDGGRIVADLGRVLPLKRISTYSRHPRDRGPQVYSVYGSAGGKTVPLEPHRPADPGQVGWTKIADVDTRPASVGHHGSRHGVAITDTAGDIGPFRYILFDVKPTEKRDRFGLTFFSEIDLVSSDGPTPIPVPTSKPLVRMNFQTEDGRYHFLIDTTEAPDMRTWSEAELTPLVREWYPKLVELLPSEGYTAPGQINLRFRTDMPNGVPASAGGQWINLNAPWFRRQLDGEAKGCVVHEMVHVVQQYGRARQTNPAATRTPGWVVEGLADYIRWFLYEPESGGALLSPKRRAQARHDASYRISANFIDWVARHHDQDIARQLNAAAREGRYRDSLWEHCTGRTVVDLADAWRQGES